MERSSRMGRLLGAGVLALSSMVFAPGVRAQEDPGVSTGRVLADTSTAVKTPEGFYTPTSIAAFCETGSERYSILNFNQGYGIFLLHKEGPILEDGFSHNIVVFVPIGLANGNYNLSAIYMCFDSEGKGTEMRGRPLEIQLRHLLAVSP